MKLEEFQRVSKNVKTVISKFRENPGKFASIVLQMYWEMKAERDTLIDDIAVLKANISRLERENRDLKTENHRLDVLNYEQSLEQSNYSALTNHIRLKAENNPGVSRYIDLVNYIDRLERD